MNEFQIIIVVLGILALIGTAAAVVYYFSTRNGNNNQNGNQNNGNQTNNLCNGGNIPVEAQITLTNPQAIPLQLFLSMCNRKRMPAWGWIIVAVLAITLLLALILFPKNSTTDTAKQTTTTTQITPAPVIPAPIPVPVPIPAPVPAKDYTSKLDSIHNAVISNGNALISTQKSSGKGYKKLLNKLDEINTGVKQANTKLDNLLIDLTAARGELSTATQELKNLLNTKAGSDAISAQTTLVKELKEKVVSIETKIDNLKNPTPQKGDSD